MKLTRAFVTAIGRERVITNREQLLGHSRDQAPFAESGTPAMLVKPESVEDVQNVISLATDIGMPVVPQGALSGLAGGANAVDGCLLLNLTNMNGVLQIDASERIARVSPGVITQRIDEAANVYGMRYPPDPSSRGWATVGGNIATNAGGMCCLKYGVTGDYVRTLDVVLAGGELLHIGHRTPKGVAGYDLSHLFVGSEGTLGVIVGAELSLRPTVSQGELFIAAFDRVADACEAVVAITRHLDPSMLELIDAPHLDALHRRGHTALPRSTAVLLVQFDGPEGRSDAKRAITQCDKACEIIQPTSQIDIDAVLETRRLAGVAMAQEGQLIVGDVTVARSTLAELLKTISHISSESDLKIAVVGHAGDGNIHPTIVIRRPDQRQTALLASDRIAEAALHLGGTITGEHGIGSVKAHGLGAELGAVNARVQWAVKQALDPQGMFNPGKGLPVFVHDNPAIPKLAAL